MKGAVLISYFLLLLGLSSGAILDCEAQADAPVAKSDSAVLPNASVPAAAPATSGGNTAAPAQSSAAKHGGKTEMHSIEWLESDYGFAAAFILALGITGTMLVYAGRSAAIPHIPKLSASFFFWLEMGYLVLLLLIATVYLKTVPATQDPELLGGIMPIAVPWFGAVGAVVISLEGIFAYGQKNWDPKYNYWHIGRPLFGAVLGMVAFFTYLIIILSAGAIPPFIDPEKHAVPKDYIVYYVLAFLVGYREETFRELIRRVTDLILKPASAPPDAPVVTFKKNGVVISSLDFGLITHPNSSTLTIEIENTGRAVLKSPSVSLDKATASVFTIASETISGSSEWKSGDVGSVELKFSPAAAGTSYSGTLAVIGSNLSTPGKLAVTGRS